MKKTKHIIIVNSIALLLIIFSYTQKHFPSLLNFSDKHYQKTGGDGLTDGLFLDLFLYGCIFLFFIFNSVLLIQFIKRKYKKGILISGVFLVLLITVQITISNLRKHKRAETEEEKLVWVKKAKTVNFSSEKLKIQFSYTDIMPGNKKVVVQENSNQITIYTEGYKERADRILLLKKDATGSLSEFLTKKDKELNTGFFDTDRHNFNKKLEVVEMYKFDTEALQKHTGLTFEDLGISKYNETEKVYFVSNTKYPSRYYAIILMPANERAANKPRLESFEGLDHNTHYFIADSWYKSLNILE